MAELTVGIDLGGTNMVSIVVGPDSQILARNKQKTGKDPGLADTATRMQACASDALAAAGGTWDEVGCVGIAIPSSIDPATGDLLHAPNLGWQDEPARPVFEQVFGRQVYLENDGNCGTLAEYMTGAGKGCQTVVGYFVGTGLGGGVVVNGRLHRGLRGVAGELGHQIIRVNGRRCGCGNRGCVEAYCSKVAFGKQFRKLIVRNRCKSVLSNKVTDLCNVRGKVLRKAYLAGDRVVCQVVNKGALMLGIAAANAVAFLAPECIVFGGGVMEALGGKLMPFIREGMDSVLFAVKPQDVNLQLSVHRDDAVPLGAALLARAGGDV